MTRTIVYMNILGPTRRVRRRGLSSRGGRLLRVCNPSCERGAVCHEILLVRTARMIMAGAQPVVTEQAPVAVRPLLSGAEIINCRRETVGTVLLRHRAQFPQGILQPLRQALKGFREADRTGLPIGIG